MARWTKKELVLPVSNKVERIKLIEEISERIKFLDLFIEARQGQIKITTRGTKEKIRMAFSEIKEIQKQVKGALYKDREGLFSYDLSYLSRKTRITVSYDLLAQYLSLSGFEVKRTFDSLKTDASIEQIAEMSRNLTTSINAIRGIIRPKNVTNLIAVIAAVMHSNPFDVLEVAIKNNLIEEKEGKHLFRKDPDEVLNFLLGQHVQNI